MVGIGCSDAALTTLQYRQKCSEVCSVVLGRMLCSLGLAAAKVMRHTDLHRSAPAAERCMAADAALQPAAQRCTSPTSAMFRCALHRYRTCEQNFLAIDAPSESFFLNVTLQWRQKTGTARSFQEHATQWAVSNARLYLGHPPPEVIAWRKRLAKVIWPVPPRTESELRRKHRGEMQHDVSIYFRLILTGNCGLGNSGLQAKLTPRANGSEACFLKQMSPS